MCLAVEVGFNHDIAMNTPRCVICNKIMIRYGKTSSGKQRWYCADCKTSTHSRVNNDAKVLAIFLYWLFHKQSQEELSCSARTFRRKTSRFWQYWPLPPRVEYPSDVVFVDGIYITRKLVVLIACNIHHVLGWYVARSEHSAAWQALLRRITPPKMVVTDGGTGFAEACRICWPETRIQRCLFHVFSSIRRRTTSHPKLPAGKELHQLSLDLLHVTTRNEAKAWLLRYAAWCSKWKKFLAEKTRLDNGSWEYTHARLRSARYSLNTLIKKDTLFTFLDPVLSDSCGRTCLPSTNNVIEGGVNAQLRSMLRVHRGLSMIKRLKAVYWWCYQHMEHPLSLADVLKVMPTEEQIARVYEGMSDTARFTDSLPGWGSAIAWNELHSSFPYQTDWD